MGFDPPKNWSKESEDLFIHKSDYRVQRRTYQGKEGWFLIPPDLDTPPLPFAMTPQGRDEAFDYFSKHEKKKKVVVAKPKKITKVKKKGDDEETPEGEEGMVKAPPAEGEEAEDEKDVEEEEETEEGEA